MTIWLTGLSGAGKTTIGQALATKLAEEDIPTALLDGDVVRLGLCSDLGFSAEDRAENVRRIAEAAALMRTAGICPIVCLMSPYSKGRHQARMLSSGRFVEVYVRAPLELCRSRDPKGLYARHAAGEITDLPGVDMPYEQPEVPELVLDTGRLSVGACVDRIARAVASLR